MNYKKKAVRGFARMVPELQHQIASAGGRAAHARGRAHEFTSQEASDAGRKGGLAAAKKRRAAQGPARHEEETFRRALLAMFDMAEAEPVSPIPPKDSVGGRSSP